MVHQSNNSICAEQAESVEATQFDRDPLKGCIEDPSYGSESNRYSGASSTDGQTANGVGCRPMDSRYGEGVEHHAEESIRQDPSRVETLTKLSAIGFPVKRVTDETLTLALKAWVWASQQIWTGKRGVSRRALVEAYIKRLCLGNGEPIRGSVRERAELARLSINTTRRVSDDLVDMGFIYKVGIDERFATLWRFGQAVHDIDLTRFPDMSIDSCLLFSDAAERGAMGPDGMRLWYMLRLYGPLCRREVASRCGVTERRATQIYRHLRTCVEGLPLVSEEQGLWVALGPSEPDVDLAQWFDDYVAVPLSTQGRAEERKKRHDLDRARAKEYLTRMATRYAQELAQLPELVIEEGDATGNPGISRA